MDQVYMYTRVCIGVSACSEFICMCVCCGCICMDQVYMYMRVCIGVFACSVYMYVRVFIGVSAWIKFICIREYV